jgi:hypothetical protein
VIKSQFGRKEEQDLSCEKLRQQLEELLEEILGTNEDDACLAKQLAVSLRGECEGGPKSHTKALLLTDLIPRLEKEARDLLRRYGRVV